MIESFKVLLEADSRGQINDRSAYIWRKRLSKPRKLRRFCADENCRNRWATHAIFFVDTGDHQDTAPKQKIKENTDVTLPNLSVKGRVKRVSPKEGKAKRALVS